MTVSHVVELRYVLTVAILTLAAAGASAADEPSRDSLGRDYYLYTPAKLDPKKTYWLVVGVHGYGGNGKGAAGLAEWVKNGDCIVVGPSFPNDGYQLLEKQADEQLVRLFDLLKKQYTLHPKLFLYGFSGGAQFSHRFMMKHPTMVAGCAAHSGGSWATGEPWHAVNPDAAGIPLVISCGEADTAKMHPSAPFGRLEWARAFEKQLAEGGFCYDAKYWPKVGHAHSAGAAKMTEECYRLATVTAPKVDAALAEAGRVATSTAKRAALTKARGLLPRPTSALLKRYVERQTKTIDAAEKGG